MLATIAHSSNFDMAWISTVMLVNTLLHIPKTIRATEMSGQLVRRLKRRDGPHTTLVMARQA
jgi:hypothetical protein